MNDPRLEELVKRALAMGLPMPINWRNSEDADDSDEQQEHDSESDQDEDLKEDSTSPEAQESTQAEDDPDEKEVRDDCDSQTTEDCHGGTEATRSVADSPSVAEDGQEDRDSDQSDDGGDEGEGEGEDGQSGDTTHSSDNGENSGEDGSGSGEGGDEGTDATQSSDKNGGQGGSGAGGNQDTPDQNTDTSDEEDNQDTSEAGSGGQGRSAKTQALLDALRARSEDREAMEMAEVQQKITETIIKICLEDCGRIRSNQTTWDVRAIARDMLANRWDKVLRDKHWTYRPRNLAVFWDQSGSCDEYYGAIAKALKTVTNLGYRIKLYDCSNGIMENGAPSIVWKVRGPNQSTFDRYENGPRLREIAKHLGARIDDNIIEPNDREFTKICERSDVVIVLQDYDCVQSIWEPAKYMISRKKCPHFIDLDNRYNHPSEHNWNPAIYSGEDYAVPERWHRIWPEIHEEEEAEA